MNKYEILHEVNKLLDNVMTDPGEKEIANTTDVNKIYACLWLEDYCHENLEGWYYRRVSRDLVTWSMRKACCCTLHHLP